MKIDWVRKLTSPIYSIQKDTLLVSFFVSVSQKAKRPMTSFLTPFCVPQEK